MNINKTRSKKNFEFEEGMSTMCCNKNDLHDHCENFYHDYTRR